MNGEPFRGFESHPLRHVFVESGSWNLKSAIVMMPTEKSQQALLLAAFAGLVILSILYSETFAQKRRHASVCGDPTARCETGVTFHPYDLPFRVPKNAVIYDTELFYAIVLKRVHVADQKCDQFISENDRLSAQNLFPHQKVFASRRCGDAGEVGYQNANSTDATNDHGRPSEFIAVFAGTTLADANRILATVKATGKFPGANVRRMRAAFNGT